MAVKKSTKPIEKLDPKDVVTTALQYQALNGKVKEISGEADALKVKLKDFVGDNGIVTDKGHIVYEKAHAGNRVTLINESRVTAKLKPDAIDKLKGTRFAAQVIETYEDVNLDKLEGLISKGKIPEEMVHELFDTSTSYAFKVKVEKDTHE